MAFPYGGEAESTAASINSMIASAVAITTAWRDSVAATSALNSGDAERSYQALVALRAFVEANKATDGLGPAIVRRYPSLAGAFNPTTEWEMARLAIEDFAAWFQQNWPKRTSENLPAFVQWGPDGQLVAFVEPMAAPAKAALISKLNAVLAAFVRKG